MSAVVRVFPPLDKSNVLDLRHRFQMATISSFFWVILANFSGNKCFSPYIVIVFSNGDSFLVTCKVLNGYIDNFSCYRLNAGLFTCVQARLASPPVRDLA